MAEEKIEEKIQENKEVIKEVKKTKKTIFEQFKEQQEKLKRLELKKEKEINETIVRSFSYLTEEETFLKFQEKIENPEIFEKIKKYILTEINTEINKKIEKNRMEK